MTSRHFRLLTRLQIINLFQNIVGKNFHRSRIYQVQALPGLILLIAALGVFHPPRGAGQTLAILHNFTVLTNNTNADGAFPYAGLLLSGNRLYGTTVNGGSSSNGTVFAVNVDGSRFTNLYCFSGFSTGPFGDGVTNVDGANPHGGLVLSGNTLYGTTAGGGFWDNGTIFAINTDGSGFTNLHQFSSAFPYGTNIDGAGPWGTLVLSGNTLYGTTQYGGAYGSAPYLDQGYGAIFAINTDGSGFTNLHSFASGGDGQNPVAGMILSGNSLYGMTPAGGPNFNGTVFAINTDGSSETILHAFSATTPPGPSPNGDGVGPYGELILSGGRLYGTAEFGGAYGRGTVFALDTNGGSFSNLYSFPGVGGPTNTAGEYPTAGLVLAGGRLYGTTSSLFALNTNGANFANVFIFAQGGPGLIYSGLALSGSTLYGSSYFGGASGNGTVFSLSLAPQLAIQISDTNIIVTWPTNVAGFDYTSATLQCATNLEPPVFWQPVAALRVFANGVATVTNPISGPQMFYQLAQ